MTRMGRDFQAGWPQKWSLENNSLDRVAASCDAICLADSD